MFQTMADDPLSSIFNLVATMIQHLRECSPEFYTNPEERDSAYVSDEHNAAINEFLNAHPILTNPKAMLCGGIPDADVAAILNWEHYNEPIPLFFLLVDIVNVFDLDDILGMIANKSFIALNDNYNKTGIYILPRVRSIHDSISPANESGQDTGDETATGDADKGSGSKSDPAEEGDAKPHKQWADTWAAGINQDFNNIYYLDQADLNLGGRFGQYSIRNTVLLDSIPYNKKFLLIALSPVVFDADFIINFSTKDSIGFSHGQFSVCGIKNSQRVHDRLRAAFGQACEVGADIVIFPEMLGDSELIRLDSTYSEAMDAMIKDAEAKGFAAPLMTLLPTWWHDNSNELYSISALNERLFVQQKQIPYNLLRANDKKEYTEALIHPKREVQVLHIDGLGRFTFPICKDLLEPDYQKLLIQTLHSTFVICPSYSQGKTQFDLASLSGRPFGCYIIWLNTCSAMHNKQPDHIGWIASPVVTEPQRNLCPRCKWKCGSDSDACLFLIRLSLDRFNQSVELEPHICPQSQDT